MLFGPLSTACNASPYTKYHSKKLSIQGREFFLGGFILFPRLPEKSNFALREGFFMSHVISIGLVRTCKLLTIHWEIILS
jgi:hypothetical protein